MTAPSMGSIEITAVTGGIEPDADGYAVTIDAGTAIPLRPDAPIRRDGVAAGQHQVHLGGLASNCAVEGTNPRTIVVVAGGTSIVSFAVTCTATSGTLEITTSTAGDAPDPDGYTVVVDNSRAQPIGINDALTVLSLTPGLHQVTLAGVAQNCRVEGDNPRPVTVTQGPIARAEFAIVCSPPGGRIAFVSTRDGNAEIYVINGDGSGLRRLTNDPAGDGGPDWSPDGSRIAFVSNQSGESALYVMNADGSGVVRLTSNSGFTGFISQPKWSPDGTRIAFTGFGQKPDVYIVNADGSGLRTLTSEGLENSRPDWSPDGSRLAFVQETEFHKQVMLINVDGSGLMPLTPNPNSYHESAQWSRDGSKIAITGFQDSPSILEIVSSDGSGLVTFSAGGGSSSAQDPAWAGDGRLAYSRAPYDEAPDEDNHYPEDFEIYVVSADQGSQVRLTTNTDYHNFDPAWSPDGGKIAFVRAQGEDSDIYTMNPDGTGLTRLTTHPARRDVDPVWSP
ncbi:MAG: TolB family protein [Acidimicrobiia bacterium]